MAAPLAVEVKPLAFSTKTYGGPGKVLKQQVDLSVLDRPLSFTWRLLHGLLYLNGGITFLYGSFLYLPWMTNFELGGWLFSFGSLTFLIADAMEWQVQQTIFKRIQCMLI
jgi:YrhK-like protein